MSQVNFGTAFLAGILSFLSPCVLPLVPGYVSFISGLSLEELSRDERDEVSRRKVLLGALAFIAGFSLVFTLLGGSASWVGGILRDTLPILIKIAGILIILFGLHTAGLLPLRWLYFEKRLHVSNLSPGMAGAFAMGFAFAFGWTPCIGPILAGILALAAEQETVVQGMSLLLVYSLGLGIPFFLAAIAVNRFLRFFKRYKRWIRWGEFAAGILLVAIGFLIFSNRLTALISFLPESLLKFSL